MIFDILSSRQKVGPYENHGKIKSFNGLPIGMIEFVEDFNKYLDGVNASNFKTSIVSAGVNALAVISSLIAVFTV